MKLRYCIFTFLIFILFINSAWAALFTVETKTDVFIAPSPQASKTSSLDPGTLVEVTHQAGKYWRIEYSNGSVGYVPASSLKQAKTKGGPLIPIMLAAGGPMLKAVISGTVNFFKSMFGMKSDLPGKSDESLPSGKEVTVLSNETGGWLRVQTTDGRIGYIQQSPQVVPLQSVTYAGQQDAGIWKNSQPIPQTATGLTLQVEVRKLDGTPVPAGGTLKLGDVYQIYITPSADCYVRITCETPNLDHVCQYYPNKFAGTQTSALFKAGYTYSSELLPSDVKGFKVDEPIGQKDILRIEAATAAPYHYVAKGDGCADTVRFKGGGFSSTGNIVNPTAQVVLEYPINTIK